MSNYITNNKKEAAQNPDLIYVNKKLLKLIPTNKIPNRCLYCRCVLPSGIKEWYTKSGTCSTWCAEMIVKDKKIHKCKYCESPTEPIVTSKEYDNGKGYIKKVGTVTGWKSVCLDCKINKRNSKNMLDDKEEILRSMLNTLVYKGGMELV